MTIIVGSNMLDKLEKIHILGIAGSKTAPLAKLLKERGVEVSGSDQEMIFPPISTILDESGIKINTRDVDKDIDLVIVGNSYKYFKRCVEEFEKTKSLGIPYISYTEFLVKNIIKQNSILVAGAYGKTTITGLLCHIFLNLNLDPSYMFGGESVNGFESTRLGESIWSIVEADENKNGLDFEPTFLYYPVKYLILTSAKWEHKESYSSEEENIDAFKRLINNIHPDGLLIYNPEDENIQKILPFCKVKAVPYKVSEQIEMQLIGDHNKNNVASVLTLCDEIGLDKELVRKAVGKYLGIKRRLQILMDNNDILIIDDFAQSPNRVEKAIQAVLSKFPGRRIKVFFEPHATLLLDKRSLLGFNRAFSDVEEVVLSKIPFKESVEKQYRSTAKDYLEEIGGKLKYMPIYEEIESHYFQNLKPGDILIHFSSGGLVGLNCLNRLISAYNKDKR